MVEREGVTRRDTFSDYGRHARARTGIYGFAVTTCHKPASRRQTLGFAFHDVFAPLRCIRLPATYVIQLLGETGPLATRFFLRRPVCPRPLARCRGLRLVCH
jgi:hypothetical protein